MRFPSSESARALTQAVLLARLCNRYHDLANYASEPLKQRIHFLSKSDGSNLNELFLWDFPFSSSLTSSSSSSAGEPSSSQTQVVSTTWISEQIKDFINQHWSADQFPLNPPNNARSWESVNIYFKVLDPETVQAIITIGQIDNVTYGPLGVVVILLQEGGLGEEGDLQHDPPCWKYHNMTILRESDILLNGWEILTDQSLPITPSQELNHEHINTVINDHDSSLGADNQDGSDGAEDDDDDDDYWGQYGDEEDEEQEDNGDEGLDQSKKASELNDATSDFSHEDDDDSYWKKYAEQQEKQDKAEKKRRQQQEQEQQVQQGSEFRLQSPNNVDQSLDLNAILASLPSIASSEPNAGSVDHLDQTMLSTILGMMVNEEATQVSTPDFEALSFQVNEPRLPSLIEENKTSLDTPLSKDSSIFDMFKSAVLQATNAGYSKDHVLEMLDTIYKSIE